MSEKSQVIKEKLDHKGIFDFKSFYGYAHSWLNDEGFGVVESKYSEKVSGNSRDIDIVWLATKELSDYFRISIKIEIGVSNLTDVEVEIDGTRKKMNKGKVTGELKGALILDPQSKWEGSSFNKFLRHIYDKYVIPKRIEEKEDKVIEAVTDFKEELKSFLELSGRR